MHNQAIIFFKNLQDEICHALEQIDGKAKFREDSWERAGGGGGRSRVIENGQVFEKAGVNFSEVFGEMDAKFASQLPGDGTKFTATGVSLVIHPLNPHVPTVHMNYRFLTKGNRSWFGGGADLTPYYPQKEDVIHFHRVWKHVCDKHLQVADYNKMKHDCDEYFYLPHRKEPRGVGGIFFDYMDHSLEAAFAFVKEAGKAFIDAYLPIVERRKNHVWTEKEKQFQEYRRGRYVEFNLIYDRGTLFGLKTAGRIESILMSLPPVVRYQYDFQAEPGSKEAELTEYWLKANDWLAESPKGSSRLTASRHNSEVQEG